MKMYQRLYGRFSAGPLILTLGLTFCGWQLNAQNLIQDGGFELGLTGGPGTGYYSSSTYGAWNVQGSTSTYLLGMPYGGIPELEGQEAFLLGNFGDPGLATQTFSTEVGREYRFSFQLNSLGGLGGNVDVFIYNSSQTNLNENVYKSYNGQWSPHIFSFIATDTTTTLRIENVEAYYSMIDDVRVVKVDRFEDGGFELGLTSGPGTFLENQSQFGEWEAIGNPALLGMPFGVALPAYEGDEAMHVGYVNGNGGVTQTFEHLNSQTFWLSFAVIGFQGQEGSVKATVKGISDTVVMDEIVEAPAGNGWTVVSFAFQSVGTYSTIEITNVTGACTIDDVRVSTTPINVALALDGVDDYVNVPGFGNQMPTTEITVEFWQRVDSAKAQSTFSCDANAFNAHVPWSNGQVYWDFGGKRLQYTPPVSIVGTWQHFALVSSVASGEMRIYRNGVLEVVDPFNAGQFTRGNFDLLIGRNAAGYFGGEIDEFRIWNVARTAEQIAANVDSQLVGNEAGLVAYYRMGDGGGSALIDESLGSSDGTLENGARRVLSTLPECGLATQVITTDFASKTFTWQYGGYQTAGIRLARFDPVYTNYNVVVSNLCFDITPQTGTVGVDVANGAGSYNLGLDYDGGDWSLETTGAAGLLVRSKGANGSTVDDAAATPGLTAGTVTAIGSGTIVTSGDDAAGIHAVSEGGSGGIGENSTILVGERGGNGGTGSSATVNSTSTIVTSGDKSVGIFAVSQGGAGGKGGNSTIANGGTGGSGANADVTTITGSGIISTAGDRSMGVLAVSQAGRGGNGGSGDSFGNGGRGNYGGDAGAAKIDGSWTITTLGNNAVGMSARSLGGAGGQAGNGTWASLDSGGSGGGSGDGSDAIVIFGVGGTIETSGEDAHGIFAQSIGGFSGTGGDNGLFFSGGNGGSAGDGGDVTVTNRGTITTRGIGANAIFAESVGGGGGSGGSGGLFTAAGASQAGGDSGAVTVNNQGQLMTSNSSARGIFAQSVGGSGGNGSTVAGLLYSVGGAGGTGGDGDTVDVYHEGSIVTGGDDSVGLFAQSIGGGGGTGGGAVSAGTLVSVAIGGTGGGGGDGAEVFVETTNQGTIDTSGTRSHGIFAQSVGGGGGNGGFAVSGSYAGGPSLSIGFGGRGGEGGSGSNVVVNSESSITTGGTNAHGIVAQSVGGGGGSGGFSIAVSGGALAGALSVGGSGGDGGNGNDVSLISTGDVWTQNERSYGLFAQSVGGGGGDGGFSISGAVGGAGLSAGLGGSGAMGGSAGSVSLESGGSITTEGADSHGIMAQSVGGGGGSGGFSMSLAVGGGGALGAALGGNGGGGGSANTVHVDNWGIIETSERHSYGILAQSVGGGGGDGGFSIAASGAYKGPALAFSMGGKGGIGGQGAAVNVVNDGEIFTDGELSHGIMAQSVGGGGGSGGFSVAAALSVESGGLGFSWGGAGGSGNAAGQVSVSNTGLISTIGDDASGVFAQSVGGGGGNGGASFSGSFTGGASKSVSVTLGGTGGGGGTGDLVTVSNNGEIETYGKNARGIFAQSVGGGGGNGGMAGSINLGVSSAGQSTQFAVSLGGSGGSGGVGGDVLIDGSGDVYTEGDASEGIFAQSIGGGGGNGGASIAVTLSLGNASKATNASYALAIGGEGGSGNFGGTVAVDRDGTIETLGDGSHGIFAQSVGGGGGTGGSARAVNFFQKTGTGTATNFSNKAKSLSFGGSGGDGGFGGAVAVTNAGAIITSGGDAHGIMAQSVGGGGGIGGNGHKDLKGLPGSVLIDGVPHEYLEETKVKAKIKAYNFGGVGGTGNNGGTVDVDQQGNITTEGDGSYGILAQSVGAGGGVGGNGTVNVDATGVLQGEFTLGGSALISDSGSTNASGNGAAVTVTLGGKVDTTGTGAHGIVAQSVGGGGGLAGNIERGLKTVGSALGYDTSYRGEGGGGEGDGGAVIVSSADDIVTRGSGATGIFAQSVGGGGGVAGNLGDYAPGEAPLNFAGSVGGVGSGGDVIVSHVGNISTLDSSAHGIYAQSAGGIGTGGLVSVSIDGQINTSGAGSDGIFAQSRGSQGAGNVSVTVEDGAGVQGGSGTGVGVRMVSRGTSTLINRGTISSVSGAAVATLYGNNTVQNFGTISGTVFLAGSGTFNNWAGATLDLDTGGSAYIGPGGTLSNSGLIRGTGEITGNVSSSGEIRAGNSPGRITINGSLSLTSSAGMFFDIGGTQPGVTHDQVNVTSFVELAGNLSLSLDNNFIPSATDSFTLLNFDSATGLFGNAANGSRISTADNLASFEVNYTSTSVEVSGYQSPDTDGDGMTDYEESLAGTDRLSDTSVLAFSAFVRNGLGHILMQFPRVTGKNYVIEYTDNIGVGVWTEVTSPAFTFPDANTAQWIDDGSQTGGLGMVFYRVKLVF